MNIDFDREITDVTNTLNLAEAYLTCEKIIIHTIKKQLDKGIADENIIEYQEKLATFFHKKIEDDQVETDCTNYRYAAEFVDTILKMPYWRSWMRTVDE